MAKSLDYWREYFRGANSDIFYIVEHAIMVAAIDCPKEFRLRRDHIAELLFSCKSTKCFGCDGVNSSVPRNGFDMKEEEGMKRKINEFEEEGRIKESKVESNGDVHQVEMEVNVNNTSNLSYGEAERLNNEIEEESQIIAEVFRIKEVLDHHQDESASVLYESLRRIQLMGLSVEILKATEIGKSVNGLKKHGSKQIRDLVRTLIEGWVVMLDAWMNATAFVSDNTSPESLKTSDIDEEEGLPSPPLDEGAFFSHSIELSQIFDGMDDDGNPRNSGEFNKNRKNGRKPNVEDTRKQQSPNKSSARNPGSVRAVKPSADQKVITAPKIQQRSDNLSIQKKPLAHQQDFNAKGREQQTDKGLIKKKPLPPQQEKSRFPDEGSIQVKLENAKRKLQKRYQEAENAKRQRTIQVMELHDIPKQGSVRNPMKPGHHNQSRHWANGRR